MLKFILRRLLHTVIVLTIMSFCIFMLIKMTPGDPVKMMVGTEGTPEKIERIRNELGLNKPLVIQYFDWACKFVQGDFGKSLIYRDDVAEMIRQRLPVTIHLGLIAWCGSFFIGLFAGVITAVRRGKLIDTLITVTANAGVAVPIFWLGIMGIYLFSLKLSWLPTMGYTSPFEDFFLNLRQIVMPSICLGVFALSSTTRQTRSSMLEVIRQDYIRSAWAKGLSERVIIIRHALKNALIPVISLQATFCRSIVGGSVLVETVFNIPGMGRLLVNSIFDKDVITVQAVIVIMTIIVGFVNLVVDISYGLLDPRIRYD